MQHFHRIYLVDSLSTEREHTMSTQKTTKKTASKKSVSTSKKATKNKTKMSAAAKKKAEEEEFLYETVLRFISKQKNHEANRKQILDYLETLEDSRRDKISGYLMNLVNQDCLRAKKKNADHITQAVYHYQITATGKEYI